MASCLLSAGMAQAVDHPDGVHLRAVLAPRWPVAMSLPVVHLTADMSAVDLTGHETHGAGKPEHGAVRQGARTVLTVVCGCGERFELSSKPKEKR